MVKDENVKEVKDAEMFSVQAVYVSQQWVFLVCLLNHLYFSMILRKG